MRKDTLEDHVRSSHMAKAFDSLHRVIFGPMVMQLVLSFVRGPSHPPHHFPAHEVLSTTLQYNLML